MKSTTGGSTDLILPDGINKDNPPAPTAQPITISSSSNKIKITRPSRFTGDKKNWEGFILAVNNYLMAYANEFKDDEQKIWFVISYLGMDDGSPCVALDWLWNWKEDNTYNGVMHANDYDQFVADLKSMFEDPNLKINTTNELWHLRQRKDTLTEYFTKFKLKAATAGYHLLDNVLIDLLKNQVWHMNRTLQGRHTNSPHLQRSEAMIIQHRDSAWRRKVMI